MLFPFDLRFIIVVEGGLQDYRVRTKGGIEIMTMTRSEY